MTFGTRSLVLAAFGGMLLLSAPIAAEAAGQGPSAGNQNSVELRKNVGPTGPQGFNVRGGARQLGGRGSFECPPNSGEGGCNIPQETITPICDGRGGGMSTTPEDGVACSVPDE